LAAVLQHRSRLLTTIVFTLWVAFISVTDLSWWQWEPPFDHSDRHYLVDNSFLAATLAATLGERLWATLFAVFVALLASIALWGWVFKSTQVLIRPSLRKQVMAFSLVCAVLFYYQQTVLDWQNTNFFAVHMERFAYEAFTSTERVTQIRVAPVEIQSPGVPVQKLGAARNVLVIAMEGLTGVYFPSVAALNAEQPQVSMRETSAWDGWGWLVPDFVTHARQTSRGLYAMLCGDYPKTKGGASQAHGDVG